MPGSARRTVEFNVILMFFQLPEKELYKMQLIKKMAETDQEIVTWGGCLERQIFKPNYWNPS